MKLYLHHPGIYTRGNFNHIKRRVEKLRAAKIDVVVSLAGPYLTDIERSKKLIYMHHPIPDGKLTISQLNDLLELASDLKKLQYSGKNIVVHCHRGRNRACLLAGLVMCKMGIPRKQALRSIRSTRKNSLANKYFVRYLLEE